MKKIYLLGLALTMLSVAAKAQTTIIDDNFDSYEIGPHFGGHWGNWYGEFADDALDIYITDRKSSSATKSAYIGPQNSLKGQDALLYMPNVFTKGKITMEWKMYVPADSMGYFNLQETDSAGESFAFQCFINTVDSSAVDTFANGESAGKSIYWSAAENGQGFVFAHAPIVPGEWFTVKHMIDLDLNTLSIFVNNTEVTYQPTDWDKRFTGEFKSVNSIDFFSLADTSSENGNYCGYYIDDVKVITENVNGISKIERSSNLVSLYPNPSSDYVNLSVKNEKITNVEVYNINGQRVLNSQPNTSLAKLDIHSLSAGVYTAKVSTKIGIFTKEFVVKK